MNKKIQTFWDMTPEQLSGVKLKDMRGIHLDDRVPASEVNLHRTTLKFKLKSLTLALVSCSFRW